MQRSKTKANKRTKGSQETDKQEIEENCHQLPRREGEVPYLTPSQGAIRKEQGRVLTFYNMINIKPTPEKLQGKDEKKRKKNKTKKLLENRMKKSWKIVTGRSRRAASC